MEPNLFPHVRKCKSALEVWRKVQELFEDRGHIRRKGLLEKLVTNKRENCDSMATYIANVMTTVSKLEKIGLRVDEDWIIYFLSVGLTDNYKPFIMSLCANGNITSHEIKMKLLDSVDRCENGEPLLSKVKYGKKIKFQKKRQCYICNSTSHLKNNCRQRSEEKQKKESTSKANKSFSAFLTMTNADAWVIDSGASSHMTSNENMLINKQKSEIEYIIAPNKEKIPVNGMGSTTIRASNKKIELHT